MRKEFFDDYDHQNDSIEYVLGSVLQTNDNSDEFAKLQEDFNAILLNGCKCNENCDEACAHGGNYELKNDQLILRDDRKCKDLIYECNENCTCSIKNCLNRKVQFGPCDDLKIKNFNEKGCGLITMNKLSKGQFVCEYAGEILTKTEAIRRDKENQELNKMNYIFCLNEMSIESSDKIQTFIDPSRKGNIGRYLNHSCEPNCHILSIRCDSIIPKLAIFTNRDINAHEELTFCYGNELDLLSNNLKACFCKSESCKKFLPNISYE